MWWEAKLTRRESVCVCVCVGHRRVGGHAVLNCIIKTHAYQYTRVHTRNRAATHHFPLVSSQEDFPHPAFKKMGHNVLSWALFICHFSLTKVISSHWSKNPSCFEWSAFNIVFSRWGLNDFEKEPNYFFPLNIVTAIHHANIFSISDDKLVWSHRFGLRINKLGRVLEVISQKTN